MTAGLELDCITLGVGGRPPLFRCFTLLVPLAEIVTLIGPSGCGKSSLLSFLTGTIDPAFRASGRVRIDGVDVTGLPPERRRIGILFQDDLLFPHMTVGQNLAYALPPYIAGRQHRRERIAAALAEAQLSGFEDRGPATLSGGQRARVAVLRALLAEPRVLLLDEPFARLDQGLREHFRAFVFDHARVRALPVLMVSHDPADAQAADGPIITLSAPT
ncbi:MAG TPA: ATP-binding cassette domain-containing protein [Alphaproteobacteria bacterium]|nr:ATP-binding cassette domain-containing protein [Alphaproteobacteria bacterium]